MPAIWPSCGNFLGCLARIANNRCTTLVEPLRRNFGLSSRVLRGKKWTEDEMGTLKEAYKTGKWTADILTHLPGRSHRAVVCKIARIAGRGQLKLRWKSAQWTPEEDRQLIAATAQDMKLDKVMTLLPGRTVSGLENRLRRLNNSSQTALKAPGGGGYDLPRPYTPQEDLIIVKSRNVDRLDWAAVTNRVPGRTIDSVQSRYHRLVPSSERVKIVTQRASMWTKEESALFENLVAEKVPAREISQLLQKSVNTVRSRMKRLELGEVMWQGRSKARIWIEDEIKTLTALWNQGKGEAEIARRLNRSYFSVVSKIKLLRRMDPSMKRKQARRRKVQPTKSDPDTT